MGPGRPVSIVEVIRNAKANARQMGVKLIRKYFTVDKFGMGLLLHKYCWGYQKSGIFSILF